jgi:phage terminase small subunit
VRPLPKAKDERAEKAFELYKQGLKLVEIADQLGIKVGTIRSWKNRYDWNATLRKKDCNVANEKTEKKAKKQKVVVEEVEQVMENDDLTDKQRLFCIYYIRCFNATKAYRKAYGCSYNTAMVEGCKTLRNPKVKEAIQMMKQEHLNREFFSEEDIFQKYMDIAFADITEYTEFGKKEIQYVDKKGKEHTAEVSFVDLKPSSEVDGTIISEISQGRDGVKIKLADRMKALQWLTDHMDLATEEQKARIAVLRAKVETEDIEAADDGFIAALNGTAMEDWSDEEKE